MSLADSYDVRLGFWTNWSHGKIEGATITLSRRNGGLLIAFIAIFIGAAGKSFWRIACFMLHRMLSTSAPQDGIYHQLQAILRNSDTAQGAAWSLGNVIWAWRVPPRFRKPFPRLFGIIALALLVSISFGIAGVFSSHITTDTANEVLLTGNNCGPLRSNDETDEDAYATLFEPHQSQRVTAYSNYALQCYSGNISAGAEDCHPYVQAKLKTTVTRNASCPFSKEMCKSDNENLIVDTGLLDSLTDFGINSAPENRFQLRLVHQCAPLVTQGFTNVSTGVNSTEEFQRYYYGAIGPVANFTQEVSLNAVNAYDSLGNNTGSPKGRARADYGISVLKAYGGPLEMSKQFSFFDPIPQLQRADADTILFFLTAHGVTYTNPVDDPWFSAHRKGPMFGNVVSNTWRPSYLQDEPAAVLGCTMQMQFCNPNIADAVKRCGPLAGMIDDSFPILDLYSTASQKTSFQWAIDVIRLGFFSISGIVDALGISALVTRQGLSNNSQGPLPINQWQVEVEQWVSASLTSIQGSFVETGNGPTALYQQFRRAPNGTEETNMCRSQKIMTTRYSSFSVLGVGLILTIGSLFMLLDLFIESIVDCVQLRRSKTTPNPTGTYARLEWEANTTLQLQRLAHEHIGVGNWRNVGWAQHPITERGEKLGMLDVRDEKHTMLIRPGVLEERRYAGDQKPSSAGSDSVSWNSVLKSPKRADTFDTEKGDVTRVDTFESLPRRKVRRIDTTATLVNEQRNEDEIARHKTES